MPVSRYSLWSVRKQKSCMITGYAGKIASGIYRKGDAVTVLPQQLETTISKIEVAGVEVEEAFAPQGVVLHLADIDISRGDAIVKTAQLPKTSNELEILLCWLDDKPLQKETNICCNITAVWCVR